MTVPQLQEKLNQLLKERENAQVAVLNYNGAIGIIQQLLSEEQATTATKSTEPVKKNTKVTPIKPE